MNSENSKSSDPHRLSFNLTDNIDLKKKDKYIALSNLSIYYTWNNKKSHTRTINSKYQPQHGMKNFNYAIDHILHQIFNIYINPIQDGGGQRSPPTSFSPVTSTNVGISPQNFLTFSFNPFATLV